MSAAGRRGLLGLAAVALCVAVGGLFLQGRLPAPVPPGIREPVQAAWAAALQPVREDGRVDYAALSRQRTTLDAYVDGLARTSPDRDPARFVTPEARLAYWLNAYNALALRAALDRWPGLRSVDTLWAGRFFWGVMRPVGGVWLSLRNVAQKLAQVGDPRVAFALAAPVLGGPGLSPVPYTPEDLDAQLNAAVRRYCARADAVTLAGHTVRLSSFFREQQAALLAALPEGREGNLLQFIWAFLPTTCEMRPGCETRAELDRVCGVKLDGCSVEFFPEDRRLNDVSSAR